ncbi:MAG: DUF6880 family protein [Desulfuromonadales bacterium]
MNSERKQRLLELGEDRLADALLELASCNDAADDLVERLIATPQENIKRFKAKLAGLKRSRRFIGWSESAGFARGLKTLLEDLHAGVEDPRTGAELVAAFYEADVGILAHCDDSSGHVGDLFRHDAKELFVNYASRCADKEWLGDLAFKVIQSDDYGVRDAVIDCAKEYLTEPVMRIMVTRLMGKAGQESDEYRKRHWLNNVESIARQLKDAPLFEQARLASWGKLSTAACVDIARIYMESADPLTALSWMEKVAVSDNFLAAERDSLLLEIYGRTGEQDKQADVAWRIFRRSRSASTLERLLDVIGHDKRDNVLTGEIRTILNESALSLVDAVFLVEIDHMADAETYLLKNAGQLNGDYYGGLLHLVEAMEKSGRLLCASVIYRALLDSILRRAQTKTYPHGVRYLKKLDKLAGSVPNWQMFEPHSAYMDVLKLQHGRKSSFWSRYGS